MSTRSQPHLSTCIDIPRSFSKWAPPRDVALLKISPGTIFGRDYSAHTELPCEWHAKLPCDGCPAPSRCSETKADENSSPATQTNWRPDLNDPRCRGFTRTLPGR